MTKRAAPKQTLTQLAEEWRKAMAVLDAANAAATLAGRAFGDALARAGYDSDLGRAADLIMAVKKEQGL